MTLKTQWQQNAHRALRLIGRFYRSAGWLGLVVTVLATGAAFISHWNTLSYGFGNPFFYKLWQALLVSGLVAALGLFLSGIGFLVGLFIEVASRLMENSVMQTDLLRRLVREQGHDEHTPTRLIEQDADEDTLADDLTYEQTNHR
jgi:hypothetical protein